MLRDLYIVPLIVVFLTGCALSPASPTLAVAPGADKTLDVFHLDDISCIAYANLNNSIQSQAGYSKCMSAKGNQVTVRPPAYYYYHRYGPPFWVYSPPSTVGPTFGLAPDAPG